MIRNLDILTDDLISKYRNKINYIIVFNTTWKVYLRDRVPPHIEILDFKEPMRGVIEDEIQHTLVPLEYAILSEDLQYYYFTSGVKFYSPHQIKCPPLTYDDLLSL